jgi:ATP-dependent RNA helicase DeaD
MTTFPEFDLDPAILAAVEKLGFESATPVQAETLPPLLEGRDMIGQARTGSGKTAAFGLPMIQRFKDGGANVRGLVLAPTRELAIQVAEAIRSFAKGLPVRVVTIYGGAPYPPQLKALRNGATIVVGTPGRVIDHLDRGTLNLSNVEMFVLDEADEMLRMGFLEPVEHILEALPKERQIVLFSATMPAPIQRVSKKFLNNPITIQVESSGLSVGHIEQFWIRAPQRRKLDILLRILQGDPHGATLIFTRTKRGCGEVADGLTKNGITADAIHGDLNQAARERVINRLRSKNLSVLVATDVAARGLDVSHLTRVVNMDYPGGPEIYVHRIGRTGRAGAKGTAITLVTPGEHRKLRFLQKAIKFDIQEMQPPSKSELATLQRNALWTDLERAHQNVDLTHASEWISEIQADNEVSIEDIAAVAIHMLTKERGISLNPPEEDVDTRPRRERGIPMDEDEMRRVNQVELFLSVGREAGIGPSDIVGALANEANISGTNIGRINLFENKAFVGVPRDIAEKIIEEIPELTIRGHIVNIALATPGSSDTPDWKKKGRVRYSKPSQRTARRAAKSSSDVAPWRRDGTGKVKVRAGRDADGGSHKGKGKGKASFKAKSKGKGTFKGKK